MVRVFGRTASLALVPLSCLVFLACEDKLKEVPPQFRPSMATTQAPTRAPVQLPPKVERRSVDPESYKDAKAPVVKLEPGKSICRECDMRKPKLLTKLKSKALSAPKSTQRSSSLRSKGLEM